MTFIWSCGPGASARIICIVGFDVARQLVREQNNSNMASIWGSIGLEHVATSRLPMLSLAPHSLSPL